jgi:hypothetical protein
MAMPSVPIAVGLPFAATSEVPALADAVDVHVNGVLEAVPPLPTVTW